MLHATQDPETIRQLEAIVDQLVSTWTHRDCAGWSALVAEDWSVTQIDGQVITKHQLLDMCHAGPPVTMDVDQLVVR